MEHFSLMNTSDVKEKIANIVIKTKIILSDVEILIFLIII